MKFKYLKFFAAAFLLYITTMSCAYYNTLFNAKDTYKQGIEIIQKEPEKDTHPQANKFFEQTIDKCWKLIEIYGDHSKYSDDALLYIVKCEFYLNKIAQAKLHVDQFIAKYPKSEFIPEANLWYGKILLAEKKVDDGKERLNFSLNNSRSSRIKAEAYYELGNLAFQDSAYTDAVEYFERALQEKIDKQYAAFIQFYLGESYFQQKQYKEAINRYKKVEKFSPSLDVEYKTKYNLAKSYSEIGKYDDALQILRKMLTAPRFKNFVPFIKSEIAGIYFQQKKVPESLELYKEVVRERAPSAGTAWASYSLAQIYENTILNVDSAVFYYGEVKKLYAKYDSVEQAENKHLFLSELKKIRDSIKNDSRLVYRLQTDAVFKDSLYNAQLEDSLKREYGLLAENPDTSAQYQHRLDSLKLAMQDSLNPDSTKSDTTEGAPPDTTKDEDQFNNFLYGTSENNSGNNNKSPEGGENTDKTQPVVRELEKRKLPQIQDDLRKNRFHLAEYFLLQIQDYDSAYFYYKKFLSAYSDSVLTPKALYSMYFIFSQPDHFNEHKQDSLEQVLISDYPASPFAKEILKKKGLLETTEEKDSVAEEGHDLFREAENLYSEDHVDSALKVYQKVASLDTSLLWAAKAQYATAWIYEHNLHNTEAAIKAYRELKEKYKQPEFVKAASKKVAPPPEETTEPAPGAEVSDSTRFENPADTTRTILAGESDIQKETDEVRNETTLPSIAGTKRYRLWRKNRATK